MIESKQQALDKLIECREVMDEIQNFYRNKNYFDSRKFETLKFNISSAIKTVIREIKEEDANNKLQTWEKPKTVPSTAR